MPACWAFIRVRFLLETFDRKRRPGLPSTLSRTTVYISQRTVLPVVKNRTSAHRGWNKCATRCVPRTITLSGGLDSKLLDVVVVVDCCLSVVNNTTLLCVVRKLWRPKHVLEGATHVEVQKS